MAEETEHVITLIPARSVGKLDAGDRVVASCSCGKYQSSPAGPGQAKRRGDAHVKGMKQ